MATDAGGFPASLGPSLVPKSEADELRGRALEAEAKLEQEREEWEAEREAECCEVCDGTGFYEEGAEWMPCEDCELGREFGRSLRESNREAVEQERERVREALFAHPEIQGREAVCEWIEAALSTPKGGEDD